MSVELLEHELITDDGARLRVWTHEPIKAEPEVATVVLAHGWTLGHRSWHRVVDALGPQVRVVAWDQRGHNGSTFAGGALRPATESIKRLGEDLRAVLQTFAPTGPVVLAGHSMGGMTVMAFAGIATPEELQRVSGVVLVSTAAGELRGTGIPGEAALMRLFTKLPTRLHLGRLVRDKRQRSLLFGDDARDEDVRLTSVLTGAVPLPTYGSFYAALMVHDEIASLERLGNTPVDIFVGDRDKLTPLKLSRRMADAMSHARLHVIPGRGHMALLEEPEAIAAAIRTDLEAGRAAGSEAAQKEN